MLASINFPLLNVVSVNDSLNRFGFHPVMTCWLRIIWCATTALFRTLVKLSVVICMGIDVSMEFHKLMPQSWTSTEVIFPSTSCVLELQIGDQYWKTFRVLPTKWIAEISPQVVAITTSQLPIDFSVLPVCIHRQISGWKNLFGPNPRNENTWVSVMSIRSNLVMVVLTG